MTINKKNVKFILPPKNSFPVNGPSDPLIFYYRFIVGFLYRRRMQIGLNFLKPSYESVLEFGHGSGLLLPTLASISKKLFAIDIDSNPILVRESLKKLNINAEISNKDLFERGYKSESFDLVIAFSVFEHIKDPRDILKELFRILKPNGKLLVGMPRVDAAMEKMFAFIGFNDINSLHVTSHKDFLFSANKYFELIKIKHMPFFLPSCASLYYNMFFGKNR